MPMFSQAAERAYARSLLTRLKKEEIRVDNVKTCILQGQAGKTTHNL